MDKDNYKIKKTTDLSHRIKSSIEKKYIIIGIILLIAIVGVLVCFYRDNK